MARPWRSILAILGVAAVGVALLANPLYLYPDGGGHYAATYHVETVDDESSAMQAIGLSERVLECPVDRPCALEATIAEDGAIESEHRIRPDERRYPVVVIGDGLYRPVERYGNDTVVLDLDAVSPREAVESAAVPASEFGADVDTAVETGSVTVYGEQVEAFERGAIVAHDDEYYYRAGYELRGGHWTGGFGLPVARSLLLAIGGGLLAYAGWRYRGLDA